TASGGGTLYYVVYRSSTSATSGFTIISNPDPTGTSFVDNAVSYGATYYYEVEAVNVFTNGPFSNVVTVTVSAPPLLAPTNLTATAGNAQVSLAWSASAGATSYSVYRSTTSSLSLATITFIANTTSTSYVDTGLTNGTTYYYAVVALNSSTFTGFSNEASATPTPVPAPANLTATAGNHQ